MDSILLNPEGDHGAPGEPRGSKAETAASHSLIN
jgi:hypothetical protein